MANLPDNGSSSGAVSHTASATLAGNRITCANTYTNRKNRCNVTFDGPPGSNRVLSAASSMFRKLPGSPARWPDEVRYIRTRARRVMRLDPAGNLLPKRRHRAARGRILLAAASGLAVIGAAGCAG